MENSPYEMVTLWMQSNLNPRQLIPSLLRYDHSKVADKAMQVRSNMNMCSYTLGILLYI
jgi:hypothetical protein